MSPGRSIQAARGLAPGTLRATAEGDKLCCLVLVAGPDWVAVDTGTGAYLRPHVPDEEAPAGPERAMAAEVPAPLALVEVTLAQDNAPRDPARPEAVSLASVCHLGPARKRSARRLLGRLVTKTPQLPLLGTLGPSVAYSDLDGGRPSVVLVEPEQRPRFGNGPEGPWCQFSLGGRRHALALKGRPEEIVDLADGGGGKRGAARPRLLVIGYGAPRRGQVPKVVLGAIS